MKNLVILWSLFAAVPAFAFSKFSVKCEGPKLDIDANELGKGKMKIEFLNNGKKARITYDTMDEPIELITNDNRFSGHDTFYRRENNMEGLGINIASDLFHEMPLDGIFYMYLTRQSGGRSVKSYMLNCKYR